MTHNSGHYAHVPRSSILLILLSSGLSSAKVIVIVSSADDLAIYQLESKLELPLLSGFSVVPFN